jgi:hypothetical protein
MRYVCQFCIASMQEVTLCERHNNNFPPTPRYRELCAFHPLLSIALNYSHNVPLSSTPPVISWPADSHRINCQRTDWIDSTQETVTGAVNVQNKMQYFLTYTPVCRRWNSSVSPVTRLRTGERANRGSITWRNEIFLFCKSVQANYWTHPASYLMGTHVSFSIFYLVDLNVLRRLECLGKYRKINFMSNTLYDYGLRLWVN